MKRTIAAVLAALTLLISGCAGSSAKELGAVFEDIKAEVSFESFREYASKDELLNFYGIEADDVLEFAGGVNTTGVAQEEIILIRAKDGEAADRIKTSLDNRYNAKLSQNRNYNAEQAEMIEKCRVEQDGSYVSMIVSPNAERITEIYKKETGKQ